MSSYDDLVTLTVSDVSQWAGGWCEIAKCMSMEPTSKVFHLVVTDPAVKDLTGDRRLFGADLFKGCDALAVVTLLHVEVVGDFAFHECKNLTEANLFSASSLVGEAFGSCSSLLRIRAPHVKLLEGPVFYACYNLLDVLLHPACENDDVDLTETFYGCLTLEVLATASNFHEKLENESEGILSYLKWRKNIDDVRREEKDGLDLRDASKAELLRVGLEVGALKIDHNGWNKACFDVVVDDEGKVVATLGDAIGRSLLTVENAEDFWGLEVGESGELIDAFGFWGR